MPDKSIRDLSGIVIDAKDHQVWSSIGTVIDCGELSFQVNGSKKSNLGIRARMFSSQAKCEVRPVKLNPGWKVMYSYLGRMDGQEVDEMLILKYNDLYAYNDGIWKPVNNWLLVEGDEDGRERPDGKLTFFSDDPNRYGFGTIVIGGKGRVFYNKNSAHRIEYINTMSNKESSLFAIEKKDVGLL